MGESRAMPIEFPDEATGLSEWKSFVLAAGLSDAISRTVTAPIDRLKTQFQVSVIVNGAKVLLHLVPHCHIYVFFALRSLIGCFLESKSTIEFTIVH